MHYAPLTTQTAATYATPWVGTNASATEVGDGNLNLVFIVTGDADCVVIKQALPYVRLVGESWPLPLSRAHYEAAALREQAKHVPDQVPALLHHDAVQALNVMEYLHPHVTLRKGWIAGERYPAAATHLGRFIGRISAATSDFVLQPEEKHRLIGDFAGNTAMCRISEDLLFDEPYFAAPMNRHTPSLAEDALRLHTDAPLKRAAQRLKQQFLTRKEVLLHGDLHSGSIMVTADDTRVIDPEFAVVGPIGFDLGMLLANMLLAGFARADESFATREAADLLTAFDAAFVETVHSQRTGSLCRPHTGNDLGAVVADTLADIRADAAGFAGIEMIRRIVGLAHVDDFESIADPLLRAERERRALACGRTLMLQPDAIDRLSAQDARSLNKSLME